MLKPLYTPSVLIKSPDFSAEGKEASIITCLLEKYSKTDTKCILPISVRTALQYYNPNLFAACDVLLLLD